MLSAPDRPLQVLITNRVLAHRTGTELYVRDLALSLLRAGHSPVVYSPLLGEVAAEIRAATVPVVDDLALIGTAPDIIHGHHGLETLAALLAFPETAAVNVCHSWSGWADAPVRFPRVLRHIAVDHTCRDRLVSEHGIAEDRVEVVLNAVDLQRFSRRPALPTRPRRALVFSNAAGGRAPHLAAIREACAAAAIEVDVAGFKSGHLARRPEDILGAYDLVFAKARAAIEAAAVGTAVVLCDAVGAGPMVTTRNFDALRPLNFGMRALRQTATPAHLAGEIAAYDAADAEAVSRRMRESASQEALIAQLLDLYRSVIAEQRQRVSDAAAEQRAAAAYLQTLAPRLHQRDLLRTLFLQLMRVPLAGSLMRRRAAREDQTHWLAQLLRSLDAD